MLCSNSSSSIGLTPPQPLLCPLLSMAAQSQPWGYAVAPTLGAGFPDFIGPCALPKLLPPLVWSAPPPPLQHQPASAAAAGAAAVVAATGRALPAVPALGLRGEDSCLSLGCESSTSTSALPSSSASSSLYRGRGREGCPAHSSNDDTSVMHLPEPQLVPDAHPRTSDCRCRRTSLDISPRSNSNGCPGAHRDRSMGPHQVSSSSSSNAAASTARRVYDYPSKVAPPEAEVLVHNSDLPEGSCWTTDSESEDWETFGDARWENGSIESASEYEESSVLSPMLLAGTTARSLTPRPNIVPRSLPPPQRAEGHIRSSKSFPWSTTASQAGPFASLQEQPELRLPGWQPHPPPRRAETPPKRRDAVAAAAAAARLADHCSDHTPENLPWSPGNQQRQVSPRDCHRVLRADVILEPNGSRSCFQSVTPPHLDTPTFELTKASRSSSPVPELLWPKEDWSSISPRGTDTGTHFHSVVSANSSAPNVHSHHWRPSTSPPTGDGSAEGEGEREGEGGVRGTWRREWDLSRHRSSQSSPSSSQFRDCHQPDFRPTHLQHAEASSTSRSISRSLGSALRRQRQTQERERKAPARKKSKSGGLDLWQQCADGVSTDLSTTRRRAHRKRIVGHPATSSLVDKSAAGTKPEDEKVSTWDRRSSHLDAATCLAGKPAFFTSHNPRAATSSAGTTPGALEAPTLSVVRASVDGLNHSPAPTHAEGAAATRMTTIANINTTNTTTTTTTTSTNTATSTAVPATARRTSGPRGSKAAAAAWRRKLHQETESSKATAASASLATGNIGEAEPERQEELEEQPNQQQQQRHYSTNSLSGMGVGKARGGFAPLSLSSNLPPLTGWTSSVSAAPPARATAATAAMTGSVPADETTPHPAVSVVQGSMRETVAEDDSAYWLEDECGKWVDDLPKLPDMPSAVLDMGATITGPPASSSRMPNQPMAATSSRREIEEVGMMPESSMRRNGRIGSFGNMIASPSRSHRPSRTPAPMEISISHQSNHGEAESPRTPRGDLLRTFSAPTPPLSPPLTPTTTRDRQNQADLGGGFGRGLGPRPDPGPDPGVWLLGDPEDLQFPHLLSAPGLLLEPGSGSRCSDADADAEWQDQASNSSQPMSRSRSQPQQQQHWDPESHRESRRMSYDAGSASLLTQHSFHRQPTHSWFNDEGYDEVDIEPNDPPLPPWQISGESPNHRLLQLKSTSW